MASPCLSLLKHLLKVGGGSKMTVVSSGALMTLLKASRTASCSASAEAGIVTTAVCFGLRARGRAPRSHSIGPSRLKRSFPLCEVSRVGRMHLTTSSTVRTKTFP